MTIDTPESAMPADTFEDEVLVAGGEACGRLVEEENRRVHHQSSSDRHHLTLTTGEITGALVRAVGKEREDLDDSSQALIPCLGIEVETHAKVVFHRERREHVGALGHVADAEGDERVRREIRDVSAA